jgi:hypothetical protein
VSHATVTATARKLGGAEETVDGRRARGIERAVGWDPWERLGGLGLAAIARTRGPREVVTVVPVPVEGGGVASLAVRADRQTATVAACRRASPERRRPTGARAGTALEAGGVHAIPEGIPGAEGGIERCQVARAGRDRADTVRTKALQRLQHAVPKAA